MNFLAPLCKLYRAPRFVFEQRQLLRLLIQRDIKTRTTGTLLGGLWMLLQPALQVAALWFLLDIVLRVRFPGLEGGFVAYFLVGMLPWLMLNEMLMRSIGLMQEYSSLYQRSVFPVAILPLVPWLVSGIFYGLTMALSFGLILGWNTVPNTLLVVLGLMVWLLPFCYALVVLGLFIRDLQQVTPFFLTLMLYLTPIFYLPSAFPEAMRWWLDVNPFAHVMVLIHALMQGHPWSWVNLAVPLALWLLAIIPAWRLFKRSEPHMREAL